jgi:hypothetical protein
MIKRRIFYIIIIIFIINFSFLQCKEKRVPLITYYNKDYRIIKEIRNNNGILISKITLSSDSSPINETIEYYTSGKIKKWVWYDKPNKYPLFGVYYNENGSLQQIRGTPFIWAPITSSNKTAVEIVKPPVITTNVVYCDYLNNVLKRKITYEPTVTDSTQWITLDEYKYDSLHKYYLICKFICSKTSKIDSFITELVP